MRGYLTMRFSMEIQLDAGVSGNVNNTHSVRMLTVNPTTNAPTVFGDQRGEAMAAVGDYNVYELTGLMIVR